MSSEKSKPTAVFIDWKKGGQWADDGRDDDAVWRPMGRDGLWRPGQPLLVPPPIARVLRVHGEQDTSPGQELATSTNYDETLDAVISAYLGGPAEDDAAPPTEAAPGETSEDAKWPSRKVELQEDLRMDTEREPEASFEPAPSAPAVRHAKGVFIVLAVLAPKRVMDEEVGDAMELITALDRSPAPWARIAIYAKVASTIIWVVINGIREVCAAILGKKKSGG